MNSLSRKIKENARKLLAKVGITRSFPNGKRSVNGGIHAIFLDSAVFTVSENTGKRPQKAGFHSLTAVNSRFFRLKTQGKCRNTRRSPIGDQDDYKGGGIYKEIGGSVLLQV